MKLDENAISLLTRLNGDYVNPHDVYRSSNFTFSRATFYRRLETLKQYGFVEWKVGKVKLTEKGLKFVYLLRGNDDNGLILESSEINENREPKQLEQLDHKREIHEKTEGDGLKFRLFEAEELKKIIDDGFVFVEYPTASFILKALLIVAGIEEKGLKTNVEKFRALKEVDFRVKLAINHFENASKQVLVFLEELIKEGKINALYVGVKNERKALANKKLVEFLQAHNFENERFKLPKESVTLFPLFLIGVIGMILVIALRSGYEHAGLLSIMMVIYFFRSILFKELRT